MERYDLGSSPLHDIFVDKTKIYFVGKSHHISSGHFFNHEVCSNHSALFGLCQYGPGVCPVYRVHWMQCPVVYSGTKMSRQRLQCT